jgi:hypothetical protein
MNKDMMNIDDFVREKLNGHPQKDDAAAAWPKMKELLDQEKPEKVAPFLFRWRKPMTFLGAAILLSALCVGGYELNQLRQTDKIQAPVAIENSANHSSQSIFTNNKNSNPSSNKAPNKDAEKNQSSTPNAQVENKHKEDIAHKPSNIAIQINTNTTNSPSENNNIASTNTKQDLGKENELTTKDHTKPKMLAAAAHAENEELNAKKITGSDPKNNDHQSLKETEGKKPNTANNTGAQTAVKDLNLQHRKDEFVTNSAAHVGKKNKVKAESSNSLKENNTQKASPSKIPNDAIAALISQDSIPTTTIITKEKSSKGFPRKTYSQSDTIANGKVALQANPSNNTNAAKKDKQNIASNQTIPLEQNKKTNTAREKSKDEFAAQAQNTPSKQANTVEQKNTATNLKKEKNKTGKLLEQLNLPQVAANAQRDLKNAQFYVGFSAGANQSLSKSNAFQGVQFGPSGELVLNKHWSLFGAIKYFNRSGGKKTINDSYAKEVAIDSTPKISGANWYYNVHTDSTNRYFNFSTLHSFELPMTIRYAFNKFYVMTGINLAYYLGINVEEVAKAHSQINQSFVQTNSTALILKESKPTLASSDFGSRLGLGYVLGAGYQITTSWQVDLRLVQNFWDNAKGNGAQKLSKDFYKLPSVQINIGYQLNRGKSKPTFGPTDK